MRELTAFESQPETSPRFVFEINWDDDETIKTYVTSSVDAQTPASSHVIASSFVSVSGQTQKINPDIATSTIGAVTVKLLDVDAVITNKISVELDNKNGLRGKICRLYIGYESIPFVDYGLRLTYVVDSITYKDGEYTINLSDIHRATRQKIFSPKQTNLKTTISATDLFIPVTTADLTLFPLFEHGAEYAQHPGQTLSYAKIEKEVFAFSSMSVHATLGPCFNVIANGRGALNTIPVEHKIEIDTEEDRRPKITEQIYIEGAAPKIIYALLTGNVIGQAGNMPEHWHLGINENYVKLSDFQNLGTDYWDPVNHSGRFVRIENPDSQDGKRYIEKEMLLWLGAFMPIYTDGSLGIKRLSAILSDSAFNVRLTESNVKSYSALNHGMASVINHIEVEWNYTDSREGFTKKTVVIDADSIVIHKEATVKRFKFKTVHTGLHTDNNIRSYFDVMRDRYSGPPIAINVECLPTMAVLEVGDTVLLTLSQVRDYTTNSTVNRVFEVQQVTTNWQTGNIKLNLFGSSQKAGALQHITANQVLNDAYYTQAGTDLSTVLTIVSGAVTANGTITGNALVDNVIYYYNGDLTIDAGVVVSITKNVQLRIRGSLHIVGEIRGIGTGNTGGVATTLFKNGTIVTTRGHFSGVAFDTNFDVDYGEVGYYGNTNAAESYALTAFGTWPAIGNNSPTFKTPQKTQGVTSVDWRELTNLTASNALTGYPDKLTGNSGQGGNPLVYYTFDWGVTTTATISANSGAGGNGGAGLLIIARGMSFAGAGKINLSGGDSTLGAAYTDASTGKNFRGGHGAPGAPGALLILLDGQATNPDITEFNFIADYGDTVTPGGVTEISIEDLSKIKVTSSFALHSGHIPYADSVINGGALGAIEKGAVGTSIKHTAKYEIIYIPADEIVEISAESLPDRTAEQAAIDTSNAYTENWSDQDATLGAIWGTNVTNRPVELTDGRIVSALDTSGFLKSGLNSLISVSSLMDSLDGANVSKNPEFLAGSLLGYSVYNNAGGSAVTLSVVADDIAPNTTGHVLRYSYDGVGSTTPGFGGLVQSISYAGDGIALKPARYVKNTKIVYKIVAKLPTDKQINEASNATGDQGSFTWLTSQAGTGDWYTYIGVRTIGTTGTFSVTGHIYFSGGADVAFTVDIARHDQVVLDSSNTSFAGTSFRDSDGNGLIDSAIKNDTITINADGSLSNAGGGAVLVAQLSDSGSLATQNTADWQTDISGIGIPDDGADVTDYVQAAADAQDRADAAEAAANTHTEGWSEQGADVTPPLPSDVNLTAYFPLDETTGNNALDVVTKTSGIINGSPQKLPGISGNHLVFNGTTDFVDTQQLMPFLKTDSFTISFWINFNDHSARASAAAGLVGKGHYYLSTWDLFLQNNHAIRFELGSASVGDGGGVTSSVLAIGEWHHITAVYDNTAVSIYTDGDLNNTSTNTSSVDFNSANTVRLGERVGDAARRLDGSLDEVRIYNKALTATEIKALFLNPGGQKAPEPGADVTQTAIDATVLTSGGLTLSTNAIVKTVNKDSYNDVTPGVFMGWDVDDYKFGVGDDLSYIRWGGVETGLEIEGTVNLGSQIIGMDSFSNENFYWRTLFDSITGYEASNAGVTSSGNTILTATTSSPALLHRRMPKSVTNRVTFGFDFYAKISLRTFSVFNASGDFHRIAIGNNPQFGVEIRWTGVGAGIDVFGYVWKGGTMYYTDTSIGNTSDGIDISLTLQSLQSGTCSFSMDGGAFVPMNEATYGSNVQLRGTDSFAAGYVLYTYVPFTTSGTSKLELHEYKIVIV